MDQLSELSKFKFSPHPPAPAGNDVLLPGTAAHLLSYNISVENHDLDVSIPLYCEIESTVVTNVFEHKTHHGMAENV